MRFGVCRLSFVVGRCSLRVVGLVLGVCCLLIVIRRIRYLLFVVWCLLLFVVGCVFFVDRCSLFVACCCSLIVACCLFVVDC